MRIGLVYERKADYQRGDSDPADADSELLADWEEDELISGLRDAGHDVVRIGDCQRLLNRINYWKKRCDLVFNRSVGYRGVERSLFAPAILDAAGMPYIGATPYVHALARNKFHAKLVAWSAGIKTPPAILFSNEGLSSIGELRYPAIVKPVAESSSIGILGERSIANNRDEAEEQARALIRLYGQPAIIETFIRGSELEIPLLGHPVVDALGASAITIRGKEDAGAAFLTAGAVYEDLYDFAGPPEHVDVDALVQAAVNAGKAIGLRDYGRTDFRVEEDGTAWFIEVETEPHLQRHSSFFMEAKKRGMGYPEMLDQIIQAAWRRVGEV